MGIGGEVEGWWRSWRVRLGSSKIADTMTPTVTDADRDAFAFHVLVNTTHRFVFFSVPKVATTAWIQLFLRLDGAEDWRTDPHYRNDRPLLSLRPAAECAAILADPTWLRAAFVRDPAERLLSAYLDKFHLRKSYIVRQFGAPERDIPFDEFVELVLDPNTDPSRPVGIHDGTNPHWRPHAWVGGLGRYADHLDFVGRFDQLQRDSQTLLTRLGLWDDVGRDGWGADGRRAMFETDDAAHRTGAAGLVRDYFSTEQLARVRAAYRVDAELFDRLGVGSVIRDH